MSKKQTAGGAGKSRSCRLRFRLRRLAVIGVALLILAGTGQGWGKNSDFLIETWQDHEGIPESSVLAIAQTPDGYLWVGSSGGLLRFNGVNFTKADQFCDLNRLMGIVAFLHTDHSGRLWAGSESGLALYDRGDWRRIQGTNYSFRSVAEDLNGRVLLGGSLGQLYTVKDDQVELFQPPAGLKPSGVFCVTDAKDGHIWLANRGFIGRLNSSGWMRVEPTNSIAKSLLAAPAQAGGLWVYLPGELRHYQANGSIDHFPAPDFDQPRELMEDRSGTIWIASVSSGLAHFRPGGRAYSITTATGLAHIAVRCVMQDAEDNIWAGGSLCGLNRLKPKQFVTLGMDDGLPDNIVRTVAEIAPDQILVGTHGGGIARIQQGQVEAASDARSQYVWSLLPDRTGRLWTGTYGDGLFVQENGEGVKSPFPLPPALGNTVVCLLEDVRGRIWVGTSIGLGVIAGHTLLACFTNSPIANFAITGLAEDAKSDTIWIGTYAHGVFRLNVNNFTNITELPGLPGKRVCSLTMDHQGYLWVGLYEHGLVGFHDGKTTLIGSAQGLPSDTVGAILDDGRGSFWLGTTHGILRVAQDELHRVAQHTTERAAFNVFNTFDGLGSEYCTEGYQPCALRDAAGQLWFATERGVVSVDPARLRLNTNPPPVLVEHVRFTDRADSNHVCLPPVAGSLVIPAGSRELEFDLAALSYTAPEKVSFAYRLAGVAPNWISLGNHRELHFRELPPGSYVLQIKAANNDGVWNEAGTALAFTLQPFLWQTLWFRLFTLLAVAGGGAFAIWRVTRNQFQRRLEQLQQQRRLEHERARLATVMETTSDFVVFADHQGGVLHINLAGRKLIGLSSDADCHTLKLAELQPPWAAELVAKEGIPAARLHGTWEGETALRHRDGHEIPVSQVIIVHRDSAEGDTFLSTIARDITGRKHAEAELQRREKYFRSLIEHASDSITVVNEQAVVSYQSSSGERILGYPAEAMLGRGLLDLAHPDDLPKAQVALKQCAAHLNTPTTLTARLRHKNGSWRTVEAVGTCILNDAGEKEIILNSRDLTDNLQLEEQFRQAQKMEAVGRLSGGVAHDFNNILTVIQGNVGLLQESTTLLPLERESLADIRDGAERAAALTRQLLAFSRRQAMQPADLDLNAVVANMTRMIKRIVGEDILITLNYAPLPLFVRADAGMMEQIFLNLVVNARDAMPGGGRVVIETSTVALDEPAAAAVPGARPGAFVCFSVSDTGCGIPAAVLPRIFEPFFTTKDVGKGTGLGLATVYGIVQQHQGWVTVASEIGRGTNFRIYLPRLAGTEISSARRPPGGSIQGGAEMILLVEDEPALRSLAKKLLTQFGYRVLEAGSGPKALEIWAEHRDEIALLVTDLVMPDGMSGRALAEQLLALDPHLKVIYTSGYSAEIAGQNFPLQTGVNFLPKPFNPQALAEIVRRALDAA